MRRLSFLYLALMVVLASGCAAFSPQSPYSQDQLKSLGEKALMAHETAVSLKYLTDAERKSPHDASIEYDLALAYNQRGIKDQALLHMKMALKIKPDYPEALNTIGYMYATSGQFDLAKAAFEKAMNNPFYQTPQVAAFNLGSLYEERGDSENALSYYRQALKFDPHDAQAWFRIGMVLEKTGKNDEARAAYESAVSESPDLAEARLRLGIMSYRAGDFKDAAGSFAQVERLAPGSDPAKEAEKYLEKINTPVPSARPLPYRSSIKKPQRAENNLIPTSRPGFGAAGLSPASAQSGNASGVIGGPANVNGAAQGSTAAVPESRPWRFIVMIGGYPDRAKAEEAKALLCGKGYHAVVRRAHGRTFVVQLQPVDTFSEASTLMAQVSGETHNSSKIVRVRAR